MTKLKTYLIISVIFPIKVHQTIDKVVKITNYYTQNSIYCTNTVRNVIKNLLRCIHHFKSDLINNMGHVRILGTDITLSVDITFAWIIHLRPGVEIRSGVGPILSVVSVVAWGISRGLVVQSGDWSAGRTGVGREERDLNVDASARIQRGLIGDRYALQSERVIFYPIIPDQAIKIGRQWTGVGRLSGVNVANLLNGGEV